MTKLGISQIISLVGFTKLGITKFSLAAFIHSKIGIVSAKSLFAFVQSITAKSFITAYAPVVIPTVVITYAGYRVVCDVMEQKKTKVEKSIKKDN